MEEEKIIFPHKREDMRTHMIIDLNHCTDTIYDSSIGEWEIQLGYEGDCLIPHFHVINEQLNFDSAIRLFEPVYFFDHRHVMNQELSVQQKYELNKWMKEKYKYSRIINWISLIFYWDFVENNVSNWHDALESEQPDYTKMVNMRSNK